jgi:Protein of unknown function (DUF3987)
MPPQHATQHSDTHPDKPSYRFNGKLPAALAHLRNVPRWVCWKYVLKDGNWTKPPFDPRTGRHASVNKPSTWATYDCAVAALERYSFDGVGLVLTQDGGMFGADLDDCITDSGSFTEHAAKVVELSESYMEVSPSGAGIRLFDVGKVEHPLKDQGTGIEVYGAGRYLTVTGNHIAGTPEVLSKALRTHEYLANVVAVAREAKKTQHAKQDALGNANDFFRNVNKTALARLDDWVHRLFSSAVKQATGGWRVSSKALGRDYQEDLSIHPSGIQDFGPERGLTPIDLVMQYGKVAAATAVDAAFWLCNAMNINPATMGWRGNGTYRGRSQSGPAQVKIEDCPDPAPLPDRLLPVAPFNFDMMLNKLRPWAEDTAERMQAPPDFSAIGIMAGLGSLIGLKVGIRPKVNDDWTEYANVWGMGIGTPGIMKSPSFSEGLRPLKLLAASAREAYKDAKAKYEIELLSAKAKSENAKKMAAKVLAKDRKADVAYLLQQDTIQEPICKRYIATNATTAALGVILLQNPNGVLVDRDELLSLLERLDDDRARASSMECRLSSRPARCAACPIWRQRPASRGHRGP